MGIEKQECLLFKENRVIKKLTMPIVGELVTAAKEMLGWFRFREYLLSTNYHQVMKKDKYYILPIDERSGLPINPYNVVDDSQLAEMTDGDRVAELAGDYEDQQMQRNQKKTRYYDFLGIAVMGVVFTFVLVVILFVAGKIDLSSITNIFGGGSP